MRSPELASCMLYANIIILNSKVGCPINNGYRNYQPIIKNYIMREALMVKTLVLGCILVLRLSGSSPSLAFI